MTLQEKLNELKVLRQKASEGDFKASRLMMNTYDNSMIALEKAVEDLESISKNSCCNQCQQAKLVANSTLSNIKKLLGVAG